MSEELVLKGAEIIGGGSDKRGKREFYSFAVRMLR